MSGATSKDEEPRPSEPPEQEVGDTPVPPWEMPTPEEKEHARPVRRALKAAIAAVDSPGKADQVIAEVESSAAGHRLPESQQSAPQAVTVESAARQVEAAARAVPEGHKTGEVLTATARALATTNKRQREAVSQAVQEVLNPEQQGATPPVEDEQKRQYLRRAVLQRLKPLDALDANFFLAVNHLPHTHLLNTIFYGLTIAFNGGAAWYLRLGMAALKDRRRLGELFRQVALPLAIATALVEFPIKAYFRRRRPFITIIQAIVIGKKPGTWSFPSGHSASAFAGAWLLNRRFPRFWGLRYVLAALVAFSRIYLGDHYPGDVASGSLLGMLFAMAFRRLLNSGKPGRR